MFVGETGVGRVVERTAELMKKGDVRQAGGIDLPTLQKYLNLWYSLSLDLFGGEISTNAAAYFATGLKGRAKEEKFADHVALQGTYAMDVVDGGAVKRQEIAMRSAMNEILRDGYVEDCQRGVDRWNKVLAEAGLSERLALPSRRFHRHQGHFAGLFFDPQGNPLTEAQWNQRKDAWLPSDADRAYVKSLQARAVTKPGEMAHWIAPPARGVDNKPSDFQYVRTQA